MIIATKSYLHMGVYGIPLRKGSHCYFLHHLDHTTGATSRTTETASPPFKKKLNWKPSSLFKIQLPLKLFPRRNPFQLTSGTRGWVIPMGR